MMSVWNQESAWLPGHCAIVMAVILRAGWDLFVSSLHTFTIYFDKANMPEG